MPVTTHDDRRLAAISFDTSTFKDLQYFLSLESLTLDRIDPDNLFQIKNSQSCFINLVTVDMKLRQRINLELDTLQSDRFSYVHPSSVVCQDLTNLGIFVYPNSTVYPRTMLDKDIIIHSGCAIAHNVHIKQGTFISGGVTIGGNSHIGAYNWIGISVSVFDKVSIVDHVILGAKSVIKHDITAPGTYGTVFTTKKVSTVKIK
jgi:acetyltransferase-like isoleucine patch superfamily enzyme